MKGATVMQRQQSQPNGCAILIVSLILIALAPVILEILGFILFWIIAMIASGGR